jgi:hypothetical protein
MRLMECWSSSEGAFPWANPARRCVMSSSNRGGATLLAHPSQAGVEKYIYDINLCNRYIWRWNISADFDAHGGLLQVYVNGEPVFAAGPQKKSPDLFTHKPGATIFKAKRSRPEATEGERELVYLVLDGDGNPTTIDDELATGTGPSRVDPDNMGSVHSYMNVDPWRSIFDSDPAKEIVPYHSGCSFAPGGKSVQ